MTTPPQHDKVLFILPALNSGGAERVLITYMNALDRAQFTPAMVTVKEEGELHRLIDKDITHEYLHAGSLLTAMPGLFSAIKRHRPRVVISTMAHMNFAVLALRPFFPKTHFIVREAITPSFFFAKHKSLKPLIRVLYKTLYPKADTVLSPSHLVFDEFKALGMAGENFRLLYNPVDVGSIRQAALVPSLSQNREATVHFIACGRLEPQKGFDRLIEALAGAQMPMSWQLDILGEGRDRTKLEELIVLNGLEDKIKLHGLISNPYPYFAQADCFVLPSRYEGLPNVVLESLACGTPVIATRESGGIQEIADNVDAKALMIVNTMNEFVTQMGMISPNPVSDYRPSLLPKAFAKDVLTSEFHKILHGIINSAAQKQ